MAAGRSLTIVLLSLSAAAVSSHGQPARDELLLPFSGGDRATVVEPRTGRLRTLSGGVDDLKGDRLAFRSNNDERLHVFRLSDVTQLEFLKSIEFERGLLQMHSGDHRAAQQSLKAALEHQQIPWVRREILAALAKNSVRLGQYRDAVAQVRLIFEDDSDTRHLPLLPLVWDERLPADQRLAAEASELESDSPVERLAAASALLDDARHRAAAVEVLEALKRHRSTPLSTLAEAQLWRLKLENSPSQTADVKGWRRRISMLPKELRPGPQYLLGRMLQQLHDYDAASRAFLWMPLMTPDDPALTALSLANAIECLERAGRSEEAALLKGTAATP